jgi:parallel beta-helix repeat protein
VINVTNMTLANCNIFAVGGVGVHVDRSSQITLSDNVISMSGSSIFTGIYLRGGKNNTVVNNQIDGGNGDDGIVLETETNDRVQSNAIRNAPDAGIEGVGLVADTLIENNTMTSVLAGINAYYATSWHRISFEAITSLVGLCWSSSLLASIPEYRRPRILASRTTLSKAMYFELMGIWAPHCGLTGSRIQRWLSSTRLRREQLSHCPLR